MTRWNRILAVAVTAMLPAEMHLDLLMETDPGLQVMLENGSDANLRMLLGPKKTTSHYLFLSHLLTIKTSQNSP